MVVEEGWLWRRGCGGGVVVREGLWRSGGCGGGDVEEG